MFRIVCMVDDRKLDRFYHGINGLVISVEAPQPVANAAVKNGRVVAETSGNDLDMLALAIRKEKLSVITPGRMKAFMIATGRKPSSYSNTLTRAIEAGMLRRRGKEYVVVKRKA